MRHSFLFLLISLPQLIFAQINTEPMGAGNTSQTSNVNASDGVYDKFVLIRWDASEKNTDFRLFRASSASGASMKELTKSWQKSTWFCDYSAEQNKDYFYAVISSDGKNASPLSFFDKGFLKKEESVANEGNLSSNEPEKYATGKQVFILISDVKPAADTVAVGGTIALSIGLQNIFDEPTPRTNLHVYLSSDTTWDFEDKLLSAKSFSSFPVNLKTKIEESITLPKNLIPGVYHLIVVASPEGDILNAKSGIAKINITNR